MRRTDLRSAAVVRTPLCPRRLRGQLIEHFRIPLHRDGYALALNSAFTAATGLLYWIVAARAYSAHAVGLNSALISSMMFLAGIASLNLSNILVRFLPESGHRTRRRVTWAYAAAGALALGAAALFIIEVGIWAPRLGFLHSDHGLQAWFLFSTLAWCLFVLQDSVLTALGRAIWVPVENAVFSVLKLGLLAVLATLIPLYGIFVSWTIAMLVSVVGVNLVIFARLLRPASERAGEAVLAIRSRAFARYFAADYVCMIAWLSTVNLTPLIVTAVAGATTNAYWALAYAVAFPLYAFAQNIATSLMLHGTSDRAALPDLARKAAVQGTRVLVPSVAVLVVAAPHVLSLFGQTYADQSATVLRLLALGALPNLVLNLAVSVARVQRRLRRAVIALGTQAVIVLGLAAPLLHSFGLRGVGIAWIGAQCVVAIGLLLTWRGSIEARSGEASRARPGAGEVSERVPEAMPPGAQSDEARSGAGQLYLALRRRLGAPQRSSPASVVVRVKPTWTTIQTRRLAARVALVGLTIATLATLAFAWPRQPSGPWHRVFFDDFGHGLRPSRWGRYSGQPGGDPGGLWAPSHAVVKHGILNLETYRDPRFGGRWVSGGVSSAPALKQTYGKYEVRLRMDRGRGVAGVALLWPSQNQWPPEIDFAESGGETNGRGHITATLHYGAGDTQVQRTLGVDFTRWHVLGVEWTPGRLVYTVDGHWWAVLRSSAVPAQAMELDLQTQAGTCGNASAPCPDSTTPARVSAQIAWVAAYAYRGPRGG